MSEKPLRRRGRGIVDSWWSVDGLDQGACFAVMGSHSTDLSIPPQDLISDTQMMVWTRRVCLNLYTLKNGPVRASGGSLELANVRPQSRESTGVGVNPNATGSLFWWIAWFVRLPGGGRKVSTAW
jgi:hypothetical protein